MKRLIDYHLSWWKNYQFRKPLLLRGARQVGKTFAVRNLGKTFESFVEVNFETNKKAHGIFNLDYDAQRIILELSLLTKSAIIPGKTLLFFDEIQAKPEAITALRYLYEEIPELHVIAAGSLLDFAIEKVGVPVGRIDFLYMHPLSFIEFLAALDESLVIEKILSHSVEKEIGPTVLEKTLRLLAHYLAFGGMPQAVCYWLQTHEALDVARVHGSLLDSYRQDFGKYARQSQVKYVELLFDSIPLQLGKRFKYSLIEGEYRKRELAPALDLLVTAGISHKIYHSSGHGAPLGAQSDPQDFKTIFLDVGLGQAVLGFETTSWILQPFSEFINKGQLVEAFVGQEIISYTNPQRKKDLFYWHKESSQGQAEVDYLLQLHDVIIPIEVKSGHGRTLKSMRSFLLDHAKSPYGIRFSMQDYSLHENIHSYPLFAIAKIFADHDPEIKKSLESLLQK